MSKKKLSDLLAEEVLSELGERPGSTRPEGMNDPKEISPEEMQRRHDAAATGSKEDREGRRDGASSFKNIEAGFLNHEFLSKLGQIVLHPQAGAYLDKVLGAGKMNKALRYAEAAHNDDLKKGTFLQDFPNILRELEDMFDEHLGKDFVKDLIKHSYEIWNRNKDKLK